MKFRLRLIILLCLSVGYVSSLAQTPSANNFIPSVPAPEAYAFSKYGDYPVSHYSGVPGIDIPVYTIRDGSAVLPITLNYHASGITVSQQASWVGLGWNLNAGGVITRNVVGLYDYETCMGDYMNSNYCFKLGSTTYPYNVFPGFVPLSDDWNHCVRDRAVATTFPSYTMSPFCQSYFSGAEAGCTTTVCGQTEIAGTWASSGYFQPDIFNFNFLNYSGSFYYHFQEQKFHPINNNTDLKIEPVGSYFSMTGIKITDPHGVVYEFMTNQKKYKDKSVSFWQDISSESFFLSRITYPDGNYVNFTYNQINTLTNDIFYVSEAYGFNDSSIPVEGSVSYHADYYYPLYLSQIQTPNIQVTFNLSSADRLDVKNSKSLTSIVVTDRNTSKSRTFNFLTIIL